MWQVTFFFLLSKFFICDFWQFDYDVFWCRSLQTYPCWNWDSWICMVISITRFGKFLASSSNRSPVPFPSFSWDTSNVQFVLLDMSQMFLKLSSFLFIPFLFLPLHLDNFQRLVFKFTDSSAWSSLLWKPSMRFSIYLLYSLVTGFLFGSS